MNTKQHQEDIQAAIYAVALSLDSFLVNGIQYGVFHRNVFSDFLQKAASNLLRDLASLEELAPQVPADCEPKVRALLAELRMRCQQMIDLVAELSSFHAFALQQVRSAAVHVSVLRAKCVQLIQGLEDCLHTPRPFYQSRPEGAAAAVNDFLANLERAFTAEWTAANAAAQRTA